MASQNGVANPWIDRYIAEVGRLLPAATRADVELEIRSLIEEEVEGRARGQATSDDVVLEVLRNFGRPQEIAVRYGAQQYLIGPALYPAFTNVLRIVLALTLAFNLLGQAIAIGMEQTWPNPFDVVSNLVFALFAGAGVTLLVFAIMERFSRVEIEKALASGQWDPRSLPVVEDGERVKVGETVFGVAFAIAALLALNLLFDRIGSYYVPGEGWGRIAVFTEEFQRYVPWISLWWALDILVNVGALARGRWNLWLRVARLGVQLVGIAVLTWMLTGPDMTTWAWAGATYRITVAIVLVATLFDAGKGVWALMTRAQRGQPQSPPAVHTL